MHRVNYQEERECVFNKWTTLDIELHMYGYRVKIISIVTEVNRKLFQEKKFVIHFINSKINRSYSIDKIVNFFRLLSFVKIEK